MGGGDFDGDGLGDLVVGISSEVLEDVVGRFAAGVVQILYGSTDGLTSRNQLWTQDSPRILGQAGPDRFGVAVASGDFDGDRASDLAVAASSEPIPSTADNAAGMVNVIYGSATGLTAAGNQLWNQNRPGIKDEANNGDFGFRLPSP